MKKTKITKAQEAEMKVEHESRKAKRNKVIARGFNFIMAVGMFAIVAFLAILNADVQVGHYVLSGFAGTSALYFTIKTIWE